MEGWEVRISGPAARDIQRLSESAAFAVLAAIEAIAANPRRLGKPLRFELEGVWSARRGPYRVLYRIHDDTRRVSVIAVGHRADIYRPR